jgi:hypothetical protein
LLQQREKTVRAGERFAVERGHGHHVVAAGQQAEAQAFFAPPLRPVAFQQRAKQGQQHVGLFREIDHLGQGDGQFDPGGVVAALQRHQGAVQFDVDGVFDVPAGPDWAKLREGIQQGLKVELRHGARRSGGNLGNRAAGRPGTLFCRIRAFRVPGDSPLLGPAASVARTRARQTLLRLQ